MIPSQSMKTSFCFALLCATGCSAASTNGLGVPSEALPATLRTAALAPNAGSNDLLYVTNYGTSTVKVYDWPSLKPTQTLRGLTHEQGLCADSKGNIFVANTNGNNIKEYAPGGSKPVATLADLPRAYPNSCAVDPISGDLAVTNLVNDSGYKRANIVIFEHAAGQPKPFAISTIYSYNVCGYDESGNLVVDGLKQHGGAAFAILQHGTSRLQPLTFDQSPQGAGGVQWDGKHWAIGDAQATISQFDIAGTKGTKVGTTTLDESGTVFEFFIFDDRVIAPEHEVGFRSGRQAQIFRYPAGGTAVGSIQGLNLPFGAVISHGN